MRLWSKGLGKLVLPLDMHKADIHVTPDDVIYSGVIREGKIVWDYTMKMNEDDLRNFTHILTDRQVLDYMAKKQGIKLLWTILIASIFFFGGLVRAAVGQGYEVKTEKELGLGPKPKKSTRRKRPSRKVESTVSNKQEQEKAA